MSGSTSFTVQTQSELLTAFEDGQAIGSITPGDARNLIGSVGQLAFAQQTTPTYNFGSISGTGTASVTKTIALANGCVQVGTISTTNLIDIEIAATGLPNTSWVRLILFLINNASGNGTLTWASSGGNISWVGSSPQPIPEASVATKFNLESIDGGATWSILL